MRILSVKSYCRKEAPKKIQKIWILIGKSCPLASAATRPPSSARWQRKMASVFVRRDFITRLPIDNLSLQIKKQVTQSSLKRPYFYFIRD